MRKILVLVICAALLAAGCGCAAQAGQRETSDPAYLTGYFYELSEKNVIRVAYPIVLSGHTDKINAMISDFVREETNRRCFDECELTEATELPVDFPSEKMYETDYSTYAFGVDYRVTSLTDDILSIVYEGMINLKQSAHPTHVFFTLNIDLKNDQIIRFDDRYVVDDALYDTFAEYAQKDLMEMAGSDVWPERWDSFSEMFCSREKFLNGMTDTNEFHFYFTEQGVGISYPVAHFAGDHIEVVIPYSELKETAAQ